jgi:aspartyl/asparaginyl-tRNA synthetase
MGKEYGDVVFLKHFPEEESFFNMKRCDDPKLVKKVDVLLGSPNIKSMEVIGSGERSVDVDQMRRSFIEQTEGKFAQLLYDKFGKDRVNKELDEYLSLPMFPRSGMGIGGTRMLNILLDKGLI